MDFSDLSESFEQPNNDETNDENRPSIGEEETTQSIEPTLENQTNLMPDMLSVKNWFKTFIREFHFQETFVYREQFISNFSAGLYSLTIRLEHLKLNANIVNAITEKPLKYLPVIETGLQELFVEFGGTIGGQSISSETFAPSEYDEYGAIKSLPKFQLLIESGENPILIRQIQSWHNERIVVIPGIIISARPRCAKAYRVQIKCRKCGHEKVLTIRSGGRSRVLLPRNCDRDDINLPPEQRCGLDPYQIISEETHFFDTQNLKLQELPEDVPTGEIPRSIHLTCARYLVDQMIPGNRVVIVGILTTDESSAGGGIKYSFVQLLGFQKLTTSGDSTAIGRMSSLSGSRISVAEEELFIAMSKKPTICQDVYDSIAPSIFSSELDILDQVKKAIACLLFGGTTKVYSDSSRTRGDINVLLLGDPGTAKSQFLKFVEQAAPISVFTSGKGSSASGLTATVLKGRDGNFSLEAGAMVIADGGVVCIDEFDKMRDEDRVAIHEAMEQQTISIAKAGITTVLNTRTSVLAAANPMFGVWDSLTETADQMEFASTILSRFDMIFLIRDIKDPTRDSHIANHVGKLQLQSQNSIDPQINAPIKADVLKKYIEYCKANCSPRLTEEALEMLETHYIDIRSKVQYEKKIGCSSTIPITVRQLEAIVRISESMAKMSLSCDVTGKHVEEAIRLFTLSTLDASNRQDSGASLTESERRMVYEIENSIRNMISIKERKSKQALVRELERNYKYSLVQQAIRAMLLIGDIVEFGDHSFMRVK